jgi:hypothetical protein
MSSSQTGDDADATTLRGNASQIGGHTVSEFAPEMETGARASDVTRGCKALDPLVDAVNALCRPLGTMLAR